MFLNDKINIKSINLSVLRFICAILVIICHAYPLSKGKDCVDPLLYYSNGSISLGMLAVAVFFISSGLLVSKSIERKNSFKEFFKARIVKIFPPLIFTICLSIIILGFFSELNYLEYFASVETYMYLSYIFMIPSYILPGVFLNNIYGQVVNGSLWTLPLEVFCYIVLFITFKLNIIKKKYLKYTILPVSLIYIIIYTINISFFILLRSYINPLFMFYLGVILYIYKDQIFFSKKLFLIDIFIFLISILLKEAWFGIYFCLPYILIYICFGIKQVSSSLNILGNISYGIYLCAFPIQQAIVSVCGGTMNVLFNIILSIPISIVFGYIIYYFSEKKFSEFILGK